MSRNFGRRCAIGLLAAATLLAGCGSSGGSKGAAGSTSSTAVGLSVTRGVTATTISVGVPYVDLASLKSLGVDLNDGNYPDAFNALIDQINADGGINGRKIVPHLIAVNPTTTTDAITACTQLVQDDHIFVAIGPEQSDCYVQTYHVPTVQGLFESTSLTGVAPNFTLLAPAAAYDPLQLKVFQKQGVFKNKKVGLFAGEVTDDNELAVVKSTLKSLGVNVVESGTDSAPATDEVAENEQAQAIAERFQSAGVNEVVAVGDGSAVWPKALQANQSTYNPSWVATDGQDLLGVSVGSSSGITAKYARTGMSSSPIPSYPEMWKDPLIQQCRKTISKAYPNDAIATPTPSSPGSDSTFLAVIEACQDMAIFTKVADAAGKDLTSQSFAQAGYGLKNITLPGTGGVPVSFGEDQSYALGPVYLITYDAAAKQYVTATKSSTK